MRTGGRNSFLLRYGTVRRVSTVMGWDVFVMEVLMINTAHVYARDDDVRPPYIGSSDIRRAMKVRAFTFEGFVLAEAYGRVPLPASIQSHRPDEDADRSRSQ